MSIKNKEKEMDVIGHLSELRTRLMITAVAFIAFFIAGFVYVEEIYSFFEKDIHIKLNITSPAEIIWIYFTIAGIIAIVASLPILCLQLWLFIKPALTKSERRASLAYIPAIFILFVIGLVAGYFVFIQLIFPFLLSLNDGMFNELFTVEKYFRFLFQVTFPFALLFELPLILMFLTSLGIITPAFLKKTRKYAYFLLLVVSALITPPDLILPIVVSVPLVLLYEVSIYLTTVVYRKKQVKHMEYMEE